jgi:hypothetical protein
MAYSKTCHALGTIQSCLFLRPCYLGKARPCSLATAQSQPDYTAGPMKILDCAVQTLKLTFAAAFGVAISRMVADVFCLVPVRIVLVERGLCVSNKKE